MGEKRGSGGEVENCEDITINEIVIPEAKGLFKPLQGSVI
jgi:hypothetical protein